MTEAEIRACMARLTPSEIDQLKDRIRAAFYSWVIKDPYPEHSFYESLPLHLRLFSVKPEPVSIHRAWQDGYEFARGLAMRACE